VADGYFVTGTDTGVGKTLVSCGLLHRFAALGRTVVGMKPVAAGAQAGPHGLRNDDVEQLLAASTPGAERALVNPYLFEPPLAPHIAARLASIEIRIDRIYDAFVQLKRQADIVVVEGVGGFLVPLSAAEDCAHMAQRLALPVVLVVAMRLGCLNHALLSAEAIRARGLQLAGWVANETVGGMLEIHANIAALEHRVGAPLLARIPFMPADATGSGIAALLRVELLS
jgi:dethiobiotin synthetase